MQWWFEPCGLSRVVVVRAGPRRREHRRPVVRARRRRNIQWYRLHTRNPDTRGPTKHLMSEQEITNNGVEITPCFLGNRLVTECERTSGGVAQEKIRLIITSEKGAATVERSTRRSCPGGGGGTGIQPEVAGEARGLGVDGLELRSHHAIRASSFRTDPAPHTTVRLDRRGRGVGRAVVHRRSRAAATRRAHDPLSTIST